MSADDKKRVSHGYSLVEVLLVIMIIGILAGGMMLAAGRGTDNTDAAAALADLEGIKSAMLAYSMAHRTRTSDGLAAFVGADPSDIMSSLDVYLTKEGDSAYLNYLEVRRDSANSLWVEFDGFPAGSSLRSALDKKIESSSHFTGSGGSGGGYTISLKVK
ncbi:MAG: type II secretion system GspH family protein [Synergistaceae bacterium]|nr:type II secretion system GspH family protein [Synergistaceae bacterium]